MSRDKRVRMEVLSDQTKSRKTVGRNMLRRCWSYVGVAFTLTVQQVSTSGGNCDSSYNGFKENSFVCQEGYYCCNIYSQKCCPEAGSNEFYDWILIISSIAVLLFVGVMSCYWCSCCPLYKRRTPTDASGVPVIQPYHGTVTQANGHIQYPRQEQYPQGVPYIIQSVSNHDQMPPFPQEPLGVQDQHDQALVPPYSPPPSPNYGVAPPYSRHPMPNHRPSIPPYQTLHTTGDSYVPLTLPVYPDEPPPHYTP